ncbi:Helicase-associated domain [Trinorchestia longiramus]|nr:Helicase-associated domain [Trinorchestia longiramus]
MLNCQLCLLRPSAEDGRCFYGAAGSPLPPTPFTLAANQSSSPDKMPLEDEPAFKKFRAENNGLGFPKQLKVNPLKKSYPINQLKGVLLPNSSNSCTKLISSECANGVSKNEGKPMKIFFDKSKELLKQRKALPIYGVKKDLLNYLHNYETNILIGETGSGKTTQVPQLLYEESMLMKGNVVITQPRRVAAISIATRVAEEVGCQLGDVVGYSVRFENMVSEATKLKFATDGMVLREAMLDPLLKRYSWVILDEAHERTINTDILFGVVKKAQRIRKEKGREPLHILVMSATMNAEKFSTYFNNCPMLMAEGREHKLTIRFTAEKQDDYVLTCLSTVLQIHLETPVSDGILVFLTGQEEIENACLAMSKIVKRMELQNCPPMKICPLYATLPQHLQMEVFQAPPCKERRVIFSTNIAEASVTIPGIRFVVDSGKAKIRTFNPKTGFDVLKVKQISQAQAWQRAGRAGREASGTCYHTYTEAQFEKMTMMPSPEIHRCNLATVVLQLLSVGVTDVMTFDFIDQPRQESLVRAVEQLILLEAIKKLPSGDLQLTEDGKKMALFPVDPRYSKILLMGPKYNCTHEVLSIVSMLSGEQVLVTPAGKLRTVAVARHKKFARLEGDHLTLLKIYQAFKASKQNKSWCRENFLNYRNLMYITSIRKQLSELCVQAGLQLATSPNDNMDDIRRCLLTGMFMNVAEMQPNRKYLSLASRDETQIHPSSWLFNSGSSYLMYNEVVHTGNSYMHCVSWVAPEWLYDVAPDYFRTHHIKADAALYAKKIS